VLIVEFNPRCLAEFGGHDPGALLVRVFTLARQVRVTSPFGDDRTFDDPDALMGYWRARDRALSADGTLLPGLLHFNLIARPQP
jgi:hypothetical protein